MVFVFVRPPRRLSCYHSHRRPSGCQDHIITIIVQHSVSSKYIHASRALAGWRLGFRLDLNPQACRSRSAARVSEPTGKTRRPPTSRYACLSGSASRISGKHIIHSKDGDSAAPSGAAVSGLGLTRICYMRFKLGQVACRMPLVPK